MGKYLIKFTKQAKKDLIKINKSRTISDRKNIKITLKELEINPRYGIGKPERLKHRVGEVWSRRINKNDRIVYEIFEKEILISVEQILGHYDDK